MAVCASAAAQATSDDQFGIHGSNTIGARLMPSIVETFATSLAARVTRRAGSDPEQVQLELTHKAGTRLALIDISSHGSGTAVPSLISGKALVGMSSRPITDKEVQALAQAGLPDLRSPDFEHVVALDGVLVLVSPDNPLTTLSMDEIAGIFGGIIRDWSAVAGPPGPINIYARDDKSGTYDTFNSLVLRPRNLALLKDAKRFESSDDLSDEVARDRNGIGFAGFAYLRSSKALSIRGDCGIVSAPNIFNVKSEEYPLARRLFLYTKGLPKGTLAADLVRYALSANAVASIKASGYIDQEFELLDRDVQMLRFAESLALNDADVDAASIKQLAIDAKSSARMSMTFRFAANSSKLDNKAASDVERLARFVEFLVKTQQPRIIVLAGFTDSVGDFARNAALSLARAQQVKDAVTRAAKVTVPANMIAVSGYSKLLPTSCNTNEDGRYKNHRVESWLR